jgi:hypothetical protein
MHWMGPAEAHCKEQRYPLPTVQHNLPFRQMYLSLYKVSQQYLRKTLRIPLQLQ